MKKEKDFYNRFDRLKEKIEKENLSTTMFSIRFNRYSVREYLFVLQKEHEEIRETVVDKFLRTGWGELKKPLRKPHFTFSKNY